MPTLKAEQNVYEYKNSEGVTEFTDQVKADKKPEKQFQIKKMTEAEEQKSKQKLDEIREKDAALDKRLARDIQLENERRRLEQEARALRQQEQRQNEQNDQNHHDLHDGYWYGSRPIYPNRPIKPPYGRPPNVRPPNVRPPNRPPNVRPPVNLPARR
ncbi:hypothetical protein [sulfur-oxidizing endosymbiont of Gigantopelta aegis]|uniref:hypothetical protein n=1 Tax=sulfur-oxidizing endosymbiont of Gigantopelta aegis TaxID=2794934 RepID=UPI0018DC3FC5|nr:hypothetical protein [sulfur-oxidizing endosymbiont of Gigantopelta aegis]